MPGSVNAASIDRRPVNGGDKWKSFPRSPCGRGSAPCPHEVSPRRHGVTVSARRTAGTCDGMQRERRQPADARQPPPAGGNGPERARAASPRPRAIVAARARRDRRREPARAAPLPRPLAPRAACRALPRARRTLELRPRPPCAVARRLSRRSGGRGGSQLKRTGCGINPSRGGCRGPSSWPGPSGRGHNSAPPSDNRGPDPTYRGTPPARDCNASAGAASGI